MHSIFYRFRQDMFLSSITESSVYQTLCSKWDIAQPNQYLALAVPMAISSASKLVIPANSDIIGPLDYAEKLYMSGLELFTEQGTVQHLRGAMISLALIKIFQSFLGHSSSTVFVIATHLIGAYMRTNLCQRLIPCQISPHL